MYRKEKGKIEIKGLKIKAKRAKINSKKVQCERR
jgi:hypothetical protein